MQIRLGNPWIGGLGIDSVSGTKSSIECEKKKQGGLSGNNINSVTSSRDLIFQPELRFGTEAKTAYAIN